jgi:hypothetical protein
MAEKDLVTRDDIEAARRAIQEAVAAGTMSPQKGTQRAEKVLHAVTPRDLYKASGGLGGSPRATKAARAERRKALYVVVGMIVFAVVAMVVITYYTGKYFG